MKVSLVFVMLLLSCTTLSYAQQSFLDTLAVQIQMEVNKRARVDTSHHMGDHQFRFYRVGEEVFGGDAWRTPQLDSTIVQIPELTDSVYYEVCVFDDPAIDSVIVDVYRGYRVAEPVFVNPGVQGEFQGGINAFFAQAETYMTGKLDNASGSDTLVVIFKNTVASELLLVHSANKTLKKGFADFLVEEKVVHRPGIRFGMPIYSVYVFKVEVEQAAVKMKAVEYHQPYALAMNEEKVYGIFDGRMLSNGDGVFPFQEECRFLWDKKLPFDFYIRKGLISGDAALLSCAEGFFNIGKESKYSGRGYNSGWYTIGVLAR